MVWVSGDWDREIMLKYTWVGLQTETALAVSGLETKSPRGLIPHPSPCVVPSGPLTISRNKKPNHKGLLPYWVWSPIATYKLLTSLSPASSSCRSLIWRLPGNLGFWKEVWVKGDDKMKHRGQGMQISGRSVDNVTQGRALV